MIPETLDPADFLGTAQTAASVVARQTGYDYDELQSEALVAVVLACREWKPAAIAADVNPEWFVAGRVKQRLRDFLRTQYGRSHSRYRTDRANVRNAVSLDMPYFGEQETLSLNDVLPDGDHNGDPEAVTVARDYLRYVERRAPERTREILRLYVDGLTFAEIAPMFGLTESRICQIVGDYRRRLARENEAVA